jgi:hypothetical protein
LNKAPYRWWRHVRIRTITGFSHTSSLWSVNSP